MVKKKVATKAQGAKVAKKAKVVEVKKAAGAVDSRVATYEERVADLLAHFKFSASIEGTAEELFNFYQGEIAAGRFEEREAVIEEVSAEDVVVEEVGTPEEVLVEVPEEVLVEVPEEVSAAVSAGAVSSPASVLAARRAARGSVLDVLATRGKVAVSEVKTPSQLIATRSHSGAMTSPSEVLRSRRDTRSSQVAQMLSHKVEDK